MVGATLSILKVTLDPGVAASVGASGFVASACPPRVQLPVAMNCMVVLVPSMPVAAVWGVISSVPFQ